MATIAALKYFFFLVAQISSGSSASLIHFVSFSMKHHRLVEDENMSVICASCCDLWVNSLKQLPLVLKKSDLCCKTS